MTLKTGDLNEDNKVPQNDVSTLTDMVYKLQNELKEMKLANTQVAPGSNVDLVKTLADFSAAQEKAKNLDFKAGIAEEDIPEDDYDEEGVLFCAPFTGYAISGDKRKGFHVNLPYNKESILFEFEGVKPIQDGKHVKLMNMSIYRSKSKKEIEWLRNYTFFNTHIYESTRGVVNFDVMKAQKLARIMTMLVNLEMHQIIARCKEYNVPISKDISEMRTHLAMKMSEAELARDQDSTQRRLLEIEKEKTLLMQSR